MGRVGRWVGVVFALSPPRHTLSLLFSSPLSPMPAAASSLSARLSSRAAISSRIAASRAPRGGAGPRGWWGAARRAGPPSTEVRDATGRRQDAAAADARRAAAAAAADARAGDMRRKKADLCELNACTRALCVCV